MPNAPEPEHEEENFAECIHGKDCPLHAENPPFNAKVLAAIEESKSFMKGSVYADWYSSFKAAKEDLEL